jgi:asparagine synthase (glutamine-hydrolysing)
MGDIVCMSGIVGIHSALGLEDSAAAPGSLAAGEAPLSSVLTALAHRGTDGLLNRDVPGGRVMVRHRPAEPVVADKDGIVVVLDGELYDLDTVHEALARNGSPAPAEANDPLLALEAYRAFGLAGLGLLSGAWAMAIWDIRERQTHLAVDRDGSGALYRTTLSDGSHLYASEPAALLAAPGVTTGPDDEVIRQFLLTGICDEGQSTFFEGVYRVPAGSVVTFSTETEGVRSARYPLPDPVERSLSASELPGPQSPGSAAPGPQTSGLGSIGFEPSDSGLPDSELPGSGPSDSELPGSGPSGSGLFDSEPSSFGDPQSESVAPVPSAGPLTAAVIDRCGGQGEDRIAVLLSHGAAGATLGLQVSGTGRAATYLAPAFPPLGGPEDETVSAAISARGEKVLVAPVDPVTELAEFVRTMGEPVPDLSAYTEYAVVRDCAGEFDVLLDAFGADLLYSRGSVKTKKAVDVAALVDEGPVRIERTDSELSRIGAVRAALRAADRIGARAGVRLRLPFADLRVVDSPPSLGAGAVGALRSGAPVQDWILRLKNRVYGEFLSESFTSRPWFRQQAVLVAFEDFIKGRNKDAALFWRFLSVELWMREFFDPAPEDAEQVEKGPLEANPGKQLDLVVAGQSWLRYPVRTELFAKDDPFIDRITAYVTEFVSQAGDAVSFTHPWYVLVSEKIVAISQGRSYFIWDIEPSWWARTLSRFVVRTPYGIGLGSPWTMQLAIQEAGLPRILLAAVLGAAGKLVGRRGVFYQVAGHSVRAIDGPTEYSAYPSNVSAKLAPARPGEVSAELLTAVRAGLIQRGFAAAGATLAGVVIIDANDIGRNVLGSAADRPAQFFEELFADNPLGQGSEQTPIAIAVRPV